MIKRVANRWALTAICGVVLLGAGCKKSDVAAVSPPSGAAVASELSDSDVTARVKTALLAEPKIKSFDIAVVTTKGDVKLTGAVENQSQIDAAIQVARGVDGVHAVHDELNIKK